MPENPFENFYTDLLQDQPEMAFQASVAQQYPGYDMMSRPQKRQRDYWSRQYGNIYNQYLGRQGQNLQSLARGEQPEIQSFSQYLEDIPFTQRYSGLTPQQRGTGTKAFAPSTRYIFY